MSPDSKSSHSNADILRVAELNLRETVLEHGLQHPVALTKLEQYAALLRHFGKIDQAVDLENQIKGIKARTATPETSQQQGEVTPPPAPIEASKGSLKPTAGPVSADEAVKPALTVKSQQVELDKSLYNARGHHIATAADGCLYTPTGKYIGHWNDGLDVYIDRNGNYLGLVLDENRLVRESNWRYDRMNFGHPPLDIDRPGWRRQPDMGPFPLPRGYEEVRMIEIE